MNIILVDSHKSIDKLKPFTFTRPIAEIKMGALSLSDKWRKRGIDQISWLVPDHLTAKYPATHRTANHYVASNVIATDDLLSEIRKLSMGKSLVAEDGQWIASLSDLSYTWQQLQSEVGRVDPVVYNGSVKHLAEKWEIFKWCREEIISDFALLTRGAYFCTAD